MRARAAGAGLRGARRRRAAGRRGGAARGARGGWLLRRAIGARGPPTRRSRRAARRRGGMGTTTCAVALGHGDRTRRSCSTSSSATGDAAEVAARGGASIPDALLRIACAAPSSTPAELAARLAPAPVSGAAGAGAARARRPRRRGRRRARARSRGGERAARGRRLRRADRRRDDARARARCGVAIVASAEARGARGVRRASLLLAGSGSAIARSGIVGTDVAAVRAGRGALVELAGVPLLAAVRSDARYRAPRTPPAAADQPVPGSPRSRRAVRVTLWERAQPEPPPRWKAPASRRPVHARPDPLAALLADPSVDEVLVNGPERCGSNAAAVAAGVGALRRCRGPARRLRRLVARAGRRIDDATDGRRAPRRRLAAERRAAAAGPRRPAAHAAPLRAAPVHARGAGRARTLDDADAELLDAVRARAARDRISGGTSTGKTSLLGALAARVDATERIVTVEDSAELRIDRPHVARLEARRASLEGSGEVGIRELVRNALRMRPDRSSSARCAAARRSTCCRR